MIAIRKNDVCFSTANGGANPFNLDRVHRTELPVELARTALDFDILKRPNYDAEGRPIPGQYHLVKSSDESFIPSLAVGERFTPINHKDVFEYITETIMPAFPQMELEMCGTIHGGGIGLIAAKFGDSFSLPNDQSEHNLRLFFNNPSNGTGRMTLGFTHVRVVCQNTLLAATLEAKADGWKVKHTKSAPEITVRAIDTIHAQARAALEMKKRAERLASIGVDSETINRCLDAVYPLHKVDPDSPGYTRLKNIREKVLVQFNGGETARTMTDDTAWKLFNSFTYPIFNPDPARLERRKTMDAAEIAYKGMTGSVGRFVRDIFSVVERNAA